VVCLNRRKSTWNALTDQNNYLYNLLLHIAGVQHRSWIQGRLWIYTTTTTTTTAVLWPFVPDYPGEPVPEETFIHSHLSWSSIILYLLPPSMASSLFNLRAWQSFCTISVQVFFGLFLGLAPSTSYSIHFFTQSLSSFRSTCRYHCNLFCCSTEIISSNPHLWILYLELLSFSLTPHIHRTILISALWSATSFSFLRGQVSLPCSMLLHTQLLYNLPLTMIDTSLLVNRGSNCLNLFYPVWFLVSTSASASPSTLAFEFIHSSNLKYVVYSWGSNCCVMIDARERPRVGACFGLCCFVLY